MAMQGNDFSAENIHHRLLQGFYDSDNEELEMELAVDEKKSHLNCISHQLRQVPYEDSALKPIAQPNRERNEDYHRMPVPDGMILQEVY